MKIIITENYQELSARANEIMRKLLIEKPNAVLGLATGSSPVGLYKNMIADYEKGITDYSRISTVNLDEYVGLPETHDQSYRYFMNDNLFLHVNVDMDKTAVPCGNTSDPAKECERYTDYLKTHRQDVQVLGLGGNGHIGFNEPGTPFDSHTHIVELKENTRRDNARFFPSLDNVPTHAITMGIADIMEAKSILLVASGTNKADAVYAMVKGAVDENCPASILQRHENVTVILDKAAASKL